MPRLLHIALLPAIGLGATGCVAPTGTAEDASPASEVLARNAPTPSAVPGDRADGIEGLAWLAGTWQGTTSRGAWIEEVWTAPRAGMMLGLSRTVQEDRIREFEFLRIVLDGDRPVYLASPSGRSPPTPFTMIDTPSTRGSVARFENRAHDFPQVIEYELASDDPMLLHVRIAGMANGSWREMSWTLRAVR